ncbi:MAG: hypothetical protein JW863_23190 [Chitinispirillaceae bacterium]|nr:hypothetical protein [Chitinispirillaceae bacterium]
MRPLTVEEIDPLWQSKENMEPEDAPGLVERLERRQPNILSYLLATGSDILEQEERAMVFFMGVLLWHVIDSLQIEVPELTLEMLVETEAKNFEMLEYLAGEPDSEFMDTVEKIMANYNQSDLLQYIIGKILQEPQKDVEITENHVGVIAIYLKTVIDCFDTIT